MLLAPLSEVVEHTRTLIRASVENVHNAKALCNTARELKANNADFRDFLFEERMTALGLRDRRIAQRALQASLP